MTQKTEIKRYVLNFQHIKKLNKMKVKTLINRLLNYDMEHDVELIILGEDEGRLAERYTCTLPDDSIDGHGGGRLLNSRKNKLKKKESNDKRG
jgi:hypothetical protein